MTPEQKKLVQHSFNIILPGSENLAALFYQRLFQLDSGLRALFTEELDRQGHKLITTLYIVVYNLDSTEKIVTAVNMLGQRHLNYGVQLHHYELVKAALLWSLQQCLAEIFTKEVEEAWKAAYDMLASLMQEGYTYNTL